MKSNIIEYFMDLVAIDSESRNEKAVAMQLQKDLEELGFTTQFDQANEKTGGNVGNLYAFLSGKSDKTPLLFCAHMDTVQPGNGIKPQIKGDYIVSDGTTVLGSDDKSGVAQIIFGIKELLAEGKELPPLEVVFTISEEIGLLGAKYLDPALLKSKIGFALDSHKVGQFMVGAPSQNSIKIKVYGKEAHAGVAPEKGINAIRVAAEAIAAMPLGRIDFETTCNIGIIKGGLATNIVPNMVEIKGEARSHNPEKLDKVTRQMIEAFETTAAMYKQGEFQARVEVEVINEYQSFFLGEEEEIVKLATKATRDLGLVPETVKGGGGSDANIFNGKGFKIIVAGTGMDKVHTVEEQISIKELELGKELVRSIIINY